MEENNIQEQNIQQPTQVAENPQPQQLNTDEIVEDKNIESTPPAEGEPPQEGGEEPAPTQQEPSTTELQNKLKEYELREEERKAIAQKLGVNDVEPDLLNLQSYAAQVENIANSALIRMCNEYGVDATPEGMAKSLDQLKETNPAKYYEFVDRAKGINYQLQSKKAEIATANYNFGINKYYNENKELVDNVPAFQKIVNDYCVANQGSPYIYDELNNITEMAISLIKSGVELGQAYALQNKAKTDTSAVQGGVGVAQTPTYTSEKIWSRAEIDRMSASEFAKNEQAIMKAMMEGRIN